MTEEFEGDLRGAVFWGADLREAQFRDVDLTGAQISHASLVDVEIDAVVDGLVVNGVDVTSFVNERDRWYPLRTVLTASDPEHMRRAWNALRQAWEGTLDRAGRLSDADTHVSVGGEFSFVQTLRHLVFAMDKWFTAPILGRSFHPVGLPNSGSVDVPWPGLDAQATPSLRDVLAVRSEQATSFADYLADLSADDLGRTVEVLENGPQIVGDCVSTVFEEEFWHHRYAERDLAMLATGG